MRIKIIWKIFFIVIILSISASAQGGNPVKGLKGAAKAISGEFPIRDIGGYRPFWGIPKLGPQIDRNFNSWLINQGKHLPSSESSFLKFGKINPNVSENVSPVSLDELPSYVEAILKRERMLKTWNKPKKPKEVKEVTDSWWLNHIGGLIEEQIYNLGIDRLKIDFEMEVDKVGYIFIISEYRYDAA